jgi:adenylate cyclase
MAESRDFEKEGLLEGLEGDERSGRLELLERLTAEGVPFEELRAAVADGRLGVLPIERALAGKPEYTPQEVADRSGIPIEVLERQWRSIGIATPERDEPVLSREDLEAAHRQRALLDSGLDPDQIAELGRTVAVAMSQFAAATRQVVAASFLSPDDNEREAADRIYEQTTGLLPLVGPTLEYVYRLHLREQLRHAALAGDPRGDAGAETISVAFADLVGFTELGEELPPEELGRVTGKLDEHARDVAHGPVRLVKLLGDAAMLTSTDTGALIEATHALLDAMADEGEGTPLIRAGVARGPVLSRGGDFYGAPVNLASRITGVARPGSILVTKEVREEVADDYAFSNAGRKHLKGISGTVDVYRCRTIEDDDEVEDDDEGADGGMGDGGRRTRRRRARHE